MITKLKDFCNIAKRTITVKNKLVSVEVKFDKKTGEYRIVDQKSSSYQDDCRLKEDQNLEEKYRMLKPAIDAYHRYYMEKRLRALVALPEEERIKTVNNKQVSKREFISQILSLIEKPITEKIEEKEFDTSLTFLSSFLKQGTFDTPGFEFSNLEEAKFINPDTDSNNPKKTTGELRRFLDKEESIQYFIDDEEYEQAKGEMKIYDSKMFSNCHGLLSARMLMYEKDGRSISIPYRCIAHNLPRFRKGRSVFTKAKSLGVFNIEWLNEQFSEQLSELSELSGMAVNSIESIFDKELYLCYMTHKGISILNTIIGRDGKRGSEKEGLNQYINKYNQSIKSSKRTKGEESKRALPMIDQLHDLILYGDKVVFPQLKDYSEVKPRIKRVIDGLKKFGAFDGRAESNKIAAFLDSLPICGKERSAHIYINSKAVSKISNALFKEWSMLDAVVPRKGNKKQAYISIQAINDFIEKLKLDDSHHVEEYFHLCKVNSIEKENESEDVFEMLKCYYEKFSISRILQKGNLNQEQIETTGFLMDAIKQLSIFISPFSIGNTMDDSDGLFYTEYNKYLEILKEFDYDYDLIRSFFYRKPFNTDKLRLHFGMGDQLLNGWTEQNHKQTNGITGHGTKGQAYLFRKKHENDAEYDYYLGIGSDHLFSGKTPGREDSEMFRKQLIESNDLCPLERFYYYQMDGKTFGGINYIKANGDVVEKKDKVLVTDIINSINQNGNESVKSEYQKYLTKIETTEKEKVTQDALLDLIKEHDQQLYNTLFENEDFKKHYNEMLERWKLAFKQASRIPQAQEFSKKEYENYQQVKDDMKIVTSQKLVDYIPVSWNELSDALKPIVQKNGKRKPQKFYLFRITNKDLSYASTMSEKMEDGRMKRESRGNENLHTMYFRAMMSTGQETFDIGTGDIFFRKATDAKILKRTPTHGKNEEGKVIVTCKSAEKQGQTRTMKCELIKDKHHTEDLYEFHLSMTQNYKPQKIGNVFTDGVVDYLKYNSTEGPDRETLHVIGVDRGERNLLYVTMIDMDGNIKYQKSLNEIVSKGVSPSGEAFEARVDYHKLAETRADEMRRNQKRYGIPLKMKEIKEGHLALAVHEIANLMIDNHAILVMEELSEGFMRSRQSQLANVYQQFENKLISKLQFCVKDKKLDFNAPGGLYKAYQLAGNKNKSNRNGFIFYVPAWMTSKIDPATGFVNIFSFNYKNEKSSRLFFNAFKSIRRNLQTGEYEFVLRYEDFKNLKVLQNVTVPKVEWTVTTYGSRIERVKEANQSKYIMIADLTEKFDNVFSNYDIDVNGDIKAQILNIDSKSLYIELIRLLKLTLQMRNSAKIDNQVYDYIISPVADPITGMHFDSRKYDSLEENAKEENSMPIDADANGAYNIARKGLMAIRQLISEKPNFKIENKDWLEEAQKNMPKYSE